MSDNRRPTTGTAFKNNEFGYEVPPGYDMMSQRKYNIALGVAVVALIIAVVLAWIGLNTHKAQITQPKTETHTAAATSS